MIRRRLEFDRRDGWRFSLPGVLCMSETSASLLDRLQASPDEDAWQRLVEIYTPLIRGWLRRQATLQPGDVATFRFGI